MNNILTDDKSNKNRSSLKSSLFFVIPSLLGIILFMIPIKYNGEITIPVAILSNFLADILGNGLTSIITITVCISAFISLVTKIVKPNFIIKIEFLNNLFNVGPLWLLARIVGAVFSVLTLFNAGPEAVISDITGAFVLNDLLTILFTIFFFAGLLLPLLLNFGLLEFFGTMLTKIMRPIFKLPGRSSIDCITSWLGDGTLGVMLTSKQYEDGFYSKREAVIIGTTFSAVSITFSLIVIDTVGLSHLFIPFYLTVSFSGVIAAIILPRIYPLNKIPDTYYNGKEGNADESVPKGYNSLTWGYKKALEKASENSDIKGFFIDGFKNVIDMWFAVLPVVMAMATSALIIAEYTSVFQILGTPFIPYLKLLGVPEAAQASQTLVVGFADMLLPSVLAANTITSEMTKFIIACTSVSQLIYMSEVGGVLLGSKIPVSFKQLVILFIERTLITLPVIVIVANILF